VSEKQHERRRGWRFPPERRHLLWDEDRTKKMPPEPVLTAAGIGPGMTVIDVGAGTGYWTIALSQMVGPEGHVIAADVEPLMVEELRSLVQERELGNVEVVTSGEYHIPVTDGTADAAVLGFVLHEPPDPGALLREITRLLKPGGRALVLDWHKWETQQGPPVEHRLSAEETRSLLEAAGYQAQLLDSPHEDLYAWLGTR
jgi:ubiquinone/menaquinone biosynthesis C-methylase UbiE